MPNGVTTSSSGGAAAAATSTPGQTDTGEKTPRFQCPADFVRFCPQTCNSSLTENPNKEFWLIKAPVSFDPKCFSGLKVPLSGLKSLKVPAAEGEARSGQQLYRVLASSHCPSDLHLLTNEQSSSNSVVFSPKFSGLLNVCENYGDSSANQTPQVVPAAPAPSIPPGLKQRFQPFGSKTPCLAESQTDGAAVPTFEAFSPLGSPKRSVEETCPEEGELRESKKKKKKETIVKTERRAGGREEQEEEEEEEAEEEMMVVKKEPVGKTQDEEMMDGSIVEEKRKKKKKKKHREREEEEEGEEEGEERTVIVKVEGVRVKCEPIDVLYSDTGDGSGKKKKKRKDREREREQMMEEEVVEPRVILTVEDVKVKCEPSDFLSGDTAETSGKKKKKKKDREKEERMEVVEPDAIVKVEGVKIKSESTDSQCGDAGEGSGKKKKKKRSRTDDD